MEHAMDVTSNAFTGADWIGSSRRDLCLTTARNSEARYRTALAAGNTAKAAQAKTCGLAYLHETLTLHGEPKQVLPDEEAARRSAAETACREKAEEDAALARLRKRIEPRANPSAFRPYSGGLPSLGKDR
jgi:hypothetical protein